MLVNFYAPIIVSILTSSITVWFAAATTRDKTKLQRIIHSAEKVIGCSLPSLQDPYVSRTRTSPGPEEGQPGLQPTPLNLETNCFSPSPPVNHGLRSINTLLIVSLALLAMLC